VLVQKRESPKVVIPVPSALRSNRKTITLATASRMIVATKRNTSRERKCSCVGVTPRATIRTSRLRARSSCDTEAIISDGAVGNRDGFRPGRNGNRFPSAFSSRRRDRGGGRWELRRRVMPSHGSERVGGRHSSSCCGRTAAVSADALRAPGFGRRAGPGRAPPTMRRCRSPATGSLRKRPGTG
jgi:hypothetical protein